MGLCYMVKLKITKEAQLEQNLIELLCEGHGQWTYRPDLKSEADLWQNLRDKIENRNKSEPKRHLMRLNGCEGKRGNALLFLNEIMG